MASIKTSSSSISFLAADAHRLQYTGDTTKISQGRVRSEMNTSSTVATWLSFTATVVGLGGLISQANAINDKLEPFHSYRNVEYLGVWFRRQPAFQW